MANEFSEIITPQKTKEGLLSKKNIFGFLLITFLVAAIGAGLVLLNREQDIRGKAATTDQGAVNNLSGCSADIDPIAKNNCSSFCTSSGCSLPGSLPAGRCEIRRFHSNQNNDQVVNDTQTGFTNNGGGNMGFTQNCGVEQIDVGCYTDELNNDGVYNDGFKTVAYAWRRYSESCGGTTPTQSPSTNPPGGGGGGAPQCGCYGSGECVDKPNNEGPTHPAGECIFDNDKGYCVWDPGRCASGGGGGGSTSTPKPGLCDDNCNDDSDCADHSPAGALLTCNKTLGRCVNKLCPNDTNIGNNCDCKTAVQACGEPCGGGYPLCGTGYACRFVKGPTQCSTSTSNPRAFCIPQPPPSGYSLPKCTVGDTGNSYVKRDSDGKSTWTQAEIIQEFCQVTAPTATPTTETALSAQCVAIKMYDQNWDNLTAAEFSALTPGTVVRFAAGGTTTGGEFQAARFSINGTQRAEVTNKVPGREEFYDEYVIPENTTNFSITVELKHSSLGWF